MLLAVISDTHLPRGARVLPRACLEQLAQADLILHAGDVSTAPVLEHLRRIGPPVEAVQGNVDDAELRSALPVEKTLDVAGVKIAMLHDSGPAKGRLERMRRRFPDAHAVVFGHSHIPLHERADGFQIFNPGSPTERRRAPQRTMGVARVEAGAVEFEHLALD